MSSLLVLGAADGAVPTYQRARQMGYRTVCVDRNPDAAAVRFADEYLMISTREPERIAAALAGRGDIAGVLAPASDVALPSQRWLQVHFGCADPVSSAAVAASTDKSVFRRVCDELGFPSYRSVSGAPGPELARSAAELRFPVLVKPVDSTGSRGVVPCPVPAGLADCARQAVAHSPSGRVIVEEFVEGVHLTVEAVIQDGRVAFHAVSSRTLTPSPRFITAAQTLPAELPEPVADLLAAQTAALCARLEHRRGALNLDVVYGHDGLLYMVEMGARCGGNGIAELIDTAYGVDLLAAGIRLAVGEPVVLTPRRPRPVLLWVLTADRSGVLADIRGLADVRAMPEVVDVRLFHQPGDSVLPYEQAANKVGYVVLSARTRDELDRACATVTERLVVEVVSP